MIKSLKVKNYKDCSNIEFKIQRSCLHLLNANFIDPLIDLWSLDPNDH